MPLSLSRKVGEQTKIGDDVSVTITRVRGRTVTLSFDAPRTTRIIRAELDDRPDKGDPRRDPE